MRLKINIFTDNTIIPINHQHIVNSWIHTCLGENNKYHDNKSNYCISNIRGGKLNDDKKTLSFNNNGFIIVTSDDNEFIGNLINGISNNDSLGYDMKIIGIEFISEELYDKFNIFRTLTPILLKEYIDDKKYRFVTIKDEDYQERLSTYLKNKLSKIDDTLDLSDFRLVIKNHVNNKVKTIMVHNVKNVSSQCDIIIYSNKKVAETIYNHGIGQSTGCGFGTVYNSKNHHLYYDNK